jgi:glycosyltransferase involved in cell wall biosynthesis
MRRKILFLGETYRTDAKIWMNGLIEFGHFDIVCFELKTRKGLLGRFIRMFEFLFALIVIRFIIKREKPDLIIAERITSYGFLAASTRFSKIVIAQQGITDIYASNPVSKFIKTQMQKFAFKHATMIHAWGEAMIESMLHGGAKENKILVLPKGVDVKKFKLPAQNKCFQSIQAIVTRSLFPEYRHEVILKAFKILKSRGIPFRLKIAGDGILYEELVRFTTSLGLENNVHFLGRIDNDKLPDYLIESNIYISMPVTEGVSTSLFEAMATGCYPIVSDLKGNRSWLKHHVNGALVKVDDSESLANQIEFVWKNHSKFTDQLKINRSFVEENISYEKNMKIIAQAYIKLINN